MQNSQKKHGWRSNKMFSMLQGRSRLGRSTVDAGMLAMSLVAMSLAGCGATTNSTGVNGCALDTECTDKEVCHPTAKICVAICNSAGDCTTNNCNDVAGITQLVCGCTSNADCGSDQVCHTEDHLCEPKCTTNSDCGGYSVTRTCNASLGQCDVSKSCTGCTADQTCDTKTGVCVTVGCSFNSDCSPNLPSCSSGKCGLCTSNAGCQGRSDGSTCDTSTGACYNANTACNASATDPGAKGGPDTCNYADFCSGGTCAPLPNLTCSAYGAMLLQWFPGVGSERSAVLYSVRNQKSYSNASTSLCGGGGPAWTADIYFYAPNGFGLSTVDWGHKAAQFRIWTAATAGQATESTPYKGSIEAGILDNIPRVDAKSGYITVGQCGSAEYQGRLLEYVDVSGRISNFVCL